MGHQSHNSSILIAVKDLNTAKPLWLKFERSLKRVVAKRIIKAVTNNRRLTAKQPRNLWLHNKSVAT